MKDNNDFRTDYSPQEIYGSGFTELANETEAKKKRKYKFYKTHRRIKLK